MVNLNHQYRKARPRSQRISFGFTLLEVMVALSVMSIVLVSVYRMHSQSLTMNTAARFYPRLPSWLRAKWLSWKPFPQAHFRRIQAISENNSPAIAGRRR